MTTIGRVTILATALLPQSPALAQRTFDPYEFPAPGLLTYTMMSARRVEPNWIEVIVRAKGKTTGELYVRKLVDCGLPRFQNLGESTTLEGLKTASGNPGEWLPVTPGFTDAAVYRASCQRLILLEP